MISAHKIEWQGLDSLEFDLIASCAFDSDSGDSPSFLNQDGVYSEHYDGHRTIHRVKKNEFFNPTFTFLKEGFGDFTMDEQRRILSWLSIEAPGWLNVYHDDSNSMTYRCFGYWEDLQLYKLGNGRVVGFVATFASSHAHAFSRPISLPSNPDEIVENEYITVNGTSPYTVECETDEYNKLLYPTITIVRGDSYYFTVSDKANTVEDISYYMIPNVIYEYIGSDNNKAYRANIGGEKRVVINVASQELNNADTTVFYHFTSDHAIKKVSVTKDNTTRVWETVGIARPAVKIENTYTFKGQSHISTTWISVGTAGQILVLDGTNKIVYNKSETDNGSISIVGDKFNWEWMPLAYGTNSISITGNCKIKFEWTEPRKVGSL